MMKSGRSKSSMMKNDPTSASANALSLESSLKQLPMMGGSSSQSNGDGRRPWGSYSQQSMSVRHSGAKNFGGRLDGLRRSSSVRPQRSQTGEDPSIALDDSSVGDESLLAYESMFNTPGPSLLGKMSSPDETDFLGESDFDSSVRTRDTYFSAQTTLSEPLHASEPTTTKRRKSKLEKIKELQESNKKLHASTRHLQVELDTKQQRIQELEIADAQAYRSDDDKHVEALMRLTAATKKQQESLTAKQAKYERAKHLLEKAHREVKRLRKQIAAKESEVADLKQENDANLAEIADLKKALSHSLQQVDSLNEMYEADRAKILLLSKELAQAKSAGPESYNGSNGDLEVFEEELAQKDEELDKHRTEIVGLVRRIEQLEAELDTTKTNANDVQAERDHSLKLLERATEKLKKDLDEKAVIIEEAHKDSVTLHDLEQSQAILRVSLEEARTELKLMQEEKQAVQLSGDEQTAALSELEEEKARLLLNLATISEELATARAQTESMAAQNIAEQMRMKGEFGSLKQEMTELQAALQEANDRNRQLNELQNSIRNSKTGSDDPTDGAISKLRLEADELNRSIQGILEDNSEHRREADELRRRKVDAESRIEELLANRSQTASSSPSAYGANELRELNEQLEEVARETREERDEWKAMADEAEARAALLSAESRRVQEQLEDETKDLRCLNEQMESEIQILLEERENLKKSMKKSKMETSEALIALSIVEKTGEEGRRAEVEAQSLRVTKEELTDEIERLTKERDSWKQAAEIAKTRPLDGLDGPLDSTDDAAGSQQAQFLQEVAEQKKRRESESRMKKGGLLSRMGASMSSIPMHRGSGSTFDVSDGELSDKDTTIEQLERKNDENEDTIAKLRSEIVRLNSSFKEEVYLKKKKIESLEYENAAYEIKVAALADQFEKSHGGRESSGPD